MDFGIRFFLTRMIPGFAPAVGIPFPVSPVSRPCKRRRRKTSAAGAIRWSIRSTRSIARTIRTGISRCWSTGCCPRTGRRCWSRRATSASAERKSEKKSTRPGALFLTEAENRKPKTGTKNYSASFFAPGFVSMLLPKTKKRWYRNSVTKFRIMLSAVTRYSFQPRVSTSQLPSQVLSGVNTA